MAKMNVLFLVIGLSVLLFQCADKIVSECEQCDDEGNIVVRASLLDIQTKVFTPSCATSGCHSAASRGGNLALTKELSFQELFNANSKSSSLKRVLPGNSAQSFLIKKIKGDGVSIMPEPPAPKLHDAVIDSIVAWIDKGALNN